jgi:hypothetical protein
MCASNSSVNRKIPDRCTMIPPKLLRQFAEQIEFFSFSADYAFPEMPSFQKPPKHFCRSGFFVALQIHNHQYYEQLSLKIWQAPSV